MKGMKPPRKGKAGAKIVSPVGTQKGLAKTK
jgi:hypothetical protein